MAINKAILGYLWRVQWRAKQRSKLEAVSRISSPLFRS